MRSGFLDACLASGPLSLEGGYRWRLQTGTPQRGPQVGSSRHLEAERFPDSCPDARRVHLLLLTGVPVVAIHNGLPFGATASVVAWHRVGEALARLARRVLMVPVLRYVDDYFGAERHARGLLLCCDCPPHSCACQAQLSGVNYEGLCSTD